MKICISVEEKAVVHKQAYTTSTHAQKSCECHELIFFEGFSAVTMKNAAFWDVM
jgi:hypothetical protein